MKLTNALCYYEGPYVFWWDFYFRFKFKFFNPSLSKKKHKSKMITQDD